MRKGIEFFPIECALSTAEKLLEAEFGCIATGILVAFYRKIYSEDGFYCHWDDRICLVFAHELHVETEIIDRFVQTALSLELFDNELFRRHHILTARSIQENYFYAVMRRKKFNFNREYLLLADEELPKNLRSESEVNADVSKDTSQTIMNTEIVSKNPKNVDRNQINADKNQHSIVDDSRQDDSRQDHTRAEETIGACVPASQPTTHSSPLPPQDTVAFGVFSNVFLTETEHRRLAQQFGEQNLSHYITRLSAYMRDSGKQYASHAAKLADWMSRDGVQAPPPVTSTSASSFSLDDLKELKNRF